MSDVIDSSGDEAGKIILGDDASQQAISFREAQAFYNEVTGKTEQISERFTKSFVLTTENISQLHQRIIQSTAQYRMVSANASFSISYQNDSSERFSSIERFNAHASAKGIPVEEVDISYRFLVVLPDTNRPQEYRISISLISRVVKLEGIRKEMAEMDFSMPLWQFDSKFTCRATIDFTDITVANSFMTVIKNWERTLDDVETSQLIKRIRPLAKYMPSIFKYSLLLAGAYYTLGVVEKYFAAPQPKTTAMFLLIAYLFNFLMWKIGSHAGKRSEKHLNQLYEISYINFSNADKRLAAECGATRKKNVLLGFLYVAGTFIVGVLASGVSNYIFK